MIKLFQLENNQVVRKINLTEKEYNLGRSSENDLVFKNSKVSRQHAFLKESQNSYEIIDNKSTNHVYVNDQKVERKLLECGDVIGISRNISLLFVNGMESESKSNAFIKTKNGITKDEVQVIKKITSKIISLHDLNEILHKILTEVVAVVKAERGFIALTNDQNEIRTEKSVGYNIDLREDSAKELLPCSIINEILEKQAPLLISDVNSHAGNSDSVYSLGIRSIMCAPLMFDRDLIGILYVDSGESIDNFQESEQHLFNILADYAAIAIKSSISYNEIKMLNEQLQNKIKTSEEKYRYFLEILPISVIVYRNNKIQYLNPAAKKLLGGADKQDLLNEPIDKFMSKDYAKHIQNHIVENDKNLKTLSVSEECFFRIDGSKLNVEVGARHFNYMDQQSIMLLARDISNRKKMEEDLLKKQKLESISLLAGGIAHDFNNILTSILGNISLVKENISQDLNLRGLLQNAEESCHNAVGLTEQLLTFAKGGEPVKEKFHLKSFIKDTILFVLRGSNINYTFNLDEKLWDLNADKGQINQVINNIVINAKHAMPEGGRIVIKAHNKTLPKSNKLQLDAGKYVQISIQDNGVGIAEKHLNKIFDPYFTTKQEGSGLGLATSYSVIQKHGGNLTVNSELGEGTTFNIYLPALTNGEKIEQQREKEIIKGAGSILFMDDEEMIRRVAKRMFEKLGYTVCLATNGEETLKIYKKYKQLNQPFDIVILDLTVQNGMGGKKTLEKLREFHNGVKAIVTSGYSGNDVIQNFKKYGFVDRVIKPYTLNKISKKLNRVINTK